MVKRFVLGVLLILSVYSGLEAAFVKDRAVKIVQPTGEVINCLLTGDEFFHFLHDQNGYTIILNSKDGFYYYAVNNNKGELIPSKYLVNTVSPKNVGIKTGIRISIEEYKRRVRFLTIGKRDIKIPHDGTLNNIVVYIKFADDTEFPDNRQHFDDMFNPSTGVSLKSYFDEVSYGKLLIDSHHFPESEMTTNLSYTDSHNRNYFRPFSETNAEGYSGETARRDREHQLLADALTSLNTEIESGLTAAQMDGDDDGFVDNVTFIIRGENDSWSDLLWAHRWALYSKDVFLNGKQVYDYTFLPVTQNDVYTLCHETFHSLGAPDLYHYNYDGYDPVGSWGLMHSGFVHMSAFMKWKYAQQKWISDIPEITSGGYYTLNPLSAETGNCYKLKSPNSNDEYFVFEFRKKEGVFEGNIPGSGLLIYRIDERNNGNADAVGSTGNEVYIYRLNGTTTVNGDLNSANFSLESGRTDFNDETNPAAFLADNSPGGIKISEISSVGETLTFRVNFGNIEEVDAFSVDLLNYNTTKIHYESNIDYDSVLIAWANTDVFGSPDPLAGLTVGETIQGGGTVLYSGNNQRSVLHENLNDASRYYYKAWSYNNDLISEGVMVNIQTPCPNIISLPYSVEFDLGLPVCWDNIDNIGNEQIWNFGNISGVFPGFSSEENGYAFVDSDAYGEGNSQNTELISGYFDFSNYSTVNVQFDHYYKHYSGQKGAFSYSTGGGDNWVEVDNWQVDVNEIENYDFTVVLAGQDSVRFKWGFTSSYGYYWLLDDISITGVLIANYLNIDKEDVYVGNSSGQLNLGLVSNLSWTAVSDQEWCTVTPSGTGDGTIAVQFTSNATVERSAEITVSATGVDSELFVITQAGLSSGNEILRFELKEQQSDAVIDKVNYTVEIEVKQGTDYSSLTPLVIVSDFAVVSPESGVEQDFSELVVYTVTAEDSEVQDWEVSVTIEAIPVKIYDIQYTLEGSGSSSYEGKTVSTYGIVTAILSGGYFIQDGDGAWNGIYVDDNLNTPVIGDSLSITGEVYENEGLTEVRNVSEYSIISFNNELPEADYIKTFEVNKEQFEGVLVETRGYCIDSDVGSNNGIWIIDDNSGDAKVEDEIFAFAPVLDNQYHVKGIVNYRLNDFSLLPRNANDIVDVTGIEDREHLPFSLYPNPAEDYVFLFSGSERINRISIYDISGKKLRTITLTSSGNRELIPLEKFNSGYYLIKVEGESRTVVLPLQIK